ncbi:MAG: hypothetical protein HYW69_00545 [Candidatus Nealsonbacteria bacterium]|nr:hypothetical protein [Candidatus Nealsonbacteria bacterium]
MVKVLDRPTIKISKEALKRGVVILDLEEYKEMEFARAKEAAPVRYLRGRAAERLDKLVEEGLREHRGGRTIDMDEYLKKNHPELYAKHFKG